MNWINEIKDRCRKTVGYSHTITGAPRSIILATAEDTCFLMEVVETLQDDLELLAEKLYSVLQDGPHLLGEPVRKKRSRVYQTGLPD